MEATVWTAIGVLAAANLGTLFYLGGKIDALGTRLDARIDAQGADLGVRIESLGARLDARIDARGADLGARIDGLSERVDGQNARIDALTVTMADHVRRHAG